jgi:hypothetical protein
MFLDLPALKFSYCILERSAKVAGTGNNDMKIGYSMNRTTRLSAKEIQTNNEVWKADGRASKSSETSSTKYARTPRLNCISQNFSVKKCASGKRA